MMLYKYRVGDEVVIIKKGVHQGRKVKVSERNKVATQLTMGGDPVYYYAVDFLNGSKVYVQEDDIKPYDLVKSDSNKNAACECGGEYETVPWHYSYCPKSKGGK